MVIIPKLYYESLQYIEATLIPLQPRYWRCTCKKNIRWSCEKQKYMQTIIQNYNDNLHEHQNQTKYYHYSFNTTWNQAI